MRTPVFLVTAMAVLLLAGCGTPAGSNGAPTLTATPTPSPTSTPAPSPTPTPTPAVVPFDGACDAALAPNVIAGILDSSDLVSAPGGIDAVEPGRGASEALLGGLVCSWSGTDAEGAPAFALLEIFPESVVPDELASVAAEFACSSAGVCGRAMTVADSWVNASVMRERGAEQPLRDEEYERLESTVGELLEQVSAADPAALAATPAGRGADWWTIPDCDALAEPAARAVPVNAEPGFPGDTLYTGAAWEISVAGGVQGWCPFHAFDVRGDVRIVQFLLQPGIGAPRADALERTGATTAEVEGADTAYVLETPHGPRIVALSGTNRLTVTAGGEVDQEALAEAAVAALAVLDG